MTRIRPINKNKYGISKHRFLELYYYCLQYNEWVDELKYKTNTVHSIQVRDMPNARTNGNATQDLAIRREELSKKCKIIEQAAMEADEELYPWILKGATIEYATYRYLKETCNIPCGQTMYYEKRKKFYWIMSNKYKK